ncbi:hypothetical protein POTOM_020269 [Populus tomentosa]|uniref:Uncharacterized protein n=1 Tax=Populus tomentosa TaxID=118781 RepID=A0A8X8D0D3_POPTO|nr:hypothetical protein POTOM_020269 [Populus tomentosa]
MRDIEEILKSKLATIKEDESESDEVEKSTVTPAILARSLPPKIACLNINGILSHASTYMHVGFRISEQAIRQIDSFCLVKLDRVLV